MNKQEVIKELEDFISFNKVEIDGMYKKEPEIGSMFTILLNAISKDFGSGEDLTEKVKKIAVSKLRFKTLNERILAYLGETPDTRNAANNYVYVIEDLNLSGKPIPVEYEEELEKGNGVFYKEENIGITARDVLRIDSVKTKYRFKTFEEALLNPLAGNFNQRQMKYLLGLPIDIKEIPKESFYVSKTSDDGIVHQTSETKNRWIIAPKDIVENIDFKEEVSIPETIVSKEGAFELICKSIFKDFNDNYLVWDVKASTNNGFDISLKKNGKKTKMWLSRSGINEILSGRTTKSGWALFKAADVVTASSAAPVTLKKVTYRFKTLYEMKRDGTKFGPGNKRPRIWNKGMDYLFGKELTSDEVFNYFEVKQDPTGVDTVTSDPLPVSSSSSTQATQDEYSEWRIFSKEEMELLYGKDHSAWKDPKWNSDMDKLFNSPIPKSVRSTQITGWYNIDGFNIDLSWTTGDKDAVEKLRKLKTKPKSTASANTTIIGNLEVMNEDLGEKKWDDAMKAVKKLGNDWRLPTKEEFETILYPNKSKIPNLGNSYWSSTESTASYACYFNFTNGYTYYSNLYNTYYVRAVRDVSSKSNNSNNSTSTTAGIPETIPPGLITEPNKGDRKSPTASANSVPEGTKAKGNDGYWYTATKTTKGYNQWKLAKK